MARLVAGAPAIAVSPTQTEYVVVDAGQLRLFSTASGEVLSSIEVALGEADVVYLALDRLVVVVRSGTHTWLALIKRTPKNNELVAVARAEIASTLEIAATFEQRLVLVDPSRDKPRLCTVSNDQLGFEPLQVRTPLRFACATPEDDVLLAARDEILRWDPVRKRATAKLHLPLETNVVAVGFASRQRQFWMARGERVVLYRFSDGRPQGEFRASGRIAAVSGNPASSRLIVAVRPADADASSPAALEQLDLGSGDRAPLGITAKESFAVIESSPPWLITVESGRDPSRSPLGPPTILGDFAIPTEKKQITDGSQRADWRSRLMPRRPGVEGADGPGEDIGDGEGDDDMPPESENADLATTDGDDDTAGELEAVAEASNEKKATVESAVKKTPSVTVARFPTRSPAAPAAPSPVRRAVLPTRQPISASSSSSASASAPLNVRPAAIDGAFGRNWRAACVSYTRTILSGQAHRAPATDGTPIRVVASRCALSPASTAIVQLLYGAWLCGEPGGGIAPVDVLPALTARSDEDAERLWSEICLGGDATVAPLAELRRGRLLLRPKVARFLDGAHAGFVIVAGEAALDAPPPAAAYRVAPGDARTIAETLAAALGNDVAILPFTDGPGASEAAEAQLLEAQLRGCVPLMEGAAFDSRMLDRQGLLVVIRRKGTTAIDALPELELSDA